MQNKKLKLLSVLLSLTICICLLSSCGTEKPVLPEEAGKIDYSAGTTQGDSYNLSVAMLLKDEDSLRDNFAYLEESTLLATDPSLLYANEENKYQNYSAIYLDESLLSLDTGSAKALANSIQSYVYSGGMVFVPNKFYSFFDLEFFGAERFFKLKGCPADDISFPDVEGDITEIQQVIKDYSHLYKDFADYEILKKYDYGYGIMPSTAVSLANSEGAAIYTVNEYGNGLVFYTSPLLPNVFSNGRYDMQEVDTTEAAFAPATLSFNQLIYDSFTALSAKLRYGYSMSRVFGYFGSPSMAWELHYEEIGGIANGSMQMFSALAEEAGQIPSYTLIRSSYKWFSMNETVNYLLREQADGTPVIKPNYYENAYSSGTHTTVDGKWLSQLEETSSISYFKDSDECKCRSYPAIFDYDGDGKLDIINGSLDGFFYYYHGRGIENGHLSFDNAKILTSESGAELAIPGYSSPALCDIDLDGNLDIVSGSTDGKLYIARGLGNLVFSDFEPFLNTDIQGTVMPYIADADGDGTPDLALGSDQGILLIYKGYVDGGLKFSHTDVINKTVAAKDLELGNWLAPCIADYDLDGKADLLVGTFDGYIAYMSLDAGEAYMLTSSDINYKDNYNYKFGHYAVPRLADINKDGLTDLIIGTQEFGMAYSIDSDNFPYKEELKTQIAFAKEHNYYIGVHYLSGSHVSAEWEDRELGYSKKAFEKYGLSTKNIGVNQHTWYTSDQSTAQTLKAAWKAGLLWNSGFGAAGDYKIAPQGAAENVLALPFFLKQNGEDTILVQPNSVVPYKDADWEDISARYEMPICLYYHCDTIYQSDADAKAKIAEVSKYQAENGYNFNKEDQLIKASAQALHQKVTTSGNLSEGLSITSSLDNTDFALYDSAAANSLGIKISFSEEFIKDKKISTDADVYDLKGNELVLGLNKEVKVFTGDSDKTHLAKVNSPAEISQNDESIKIAFKEDGMMQVWIKGECEAPKSWTKTVYGDYTIYTKFGKAETLEVNVK